MWMGIRARQRRAQMPTEKSNNINNLIIIRCERIFIELRAMGSFSKTPKKKTNNKQTGKKMTEVGGMRSY